MTDERPLADADVVMVGILFPDPRPRHLVEADLDRLRAVDPRIRVLEVAYEESHALRTARGQAPGDDLRSEAPELTPEQRAMFAEVDVVLALDLPFDVATAAPGLRLVHGVGAGVGQLVSAGLAGSDIRLANAVGVSAVSIAEFAVGRLLEAWKRLPAMAERQARHEWEPLYGRELAGRTAAVLGLGAIGSNIARRLRAFDMTVLGVRRSWAPGATHPDVDEVHPTEALHEVLGRADAVLAAVPETPETIGMMDAAAFAAMRPGAFFANVGRGSLVDEPALVEALRSGQVGWAALDVFAVEPLPADSPLWDLPNVRVSAHASASVERYFDNLHALFRDNVGRFLAGEALRTEVDPARGY